MGQKYLLLKSIKYGVNGKRTLRWSIFAMELIGVYCPFMDYRPSKNVSRDHGIKCEIVSLAKTIILCTIRKTILWSSIFAVEFRADFCSIWGYLTKKNGSPDHDVKRNLLLMQNL